MTAVRANYDEPWKEALDQYFDSFLAFFFPRAYDAIDWTQTPESLDKELQEITASSTTQTYIADKLYKVWLLDKQPAWILIHIEVQSQYDTDFQQRMYIYNYRAFDLYRQFVVGLAILGDTDNNWRPNSYQNQMLDCELRFQFPIAKLLDYESPWDELEVNPNPFAVIVMAHLKTKATTGKPPEREAWKWRIIRGLYERGLTKTDVIKLFKIIDTMMTLPKELQTGLVRKIRSFEEDTKMPLISPTEQLAMERGLEQGLEREQQLIIKQLHRRLGGLEPSQLEAMYTLNFDQLDLLGEALLDFTCVADLQQWLESQ